MIYKFVYYNSGGFALGSERQYNFGKCFDNNLDLVQAVKKALVEEHVLNAISNIELDVLIDLDFEDSQKKQSEIFDEYVGGYYASVTDPQVRVELCDVFLDVRKRVDSVEKIEL